MPLPRQIPPLQKMEVADLIDAAIRLYRHNFIPLLEIVAVVHGPLMGTQIVVNYLLFRHLMATGGEQIPWLALAGSIPMFLLLIVAWLVLFPLSEGALAVGISEIYLGRQISLASVYRRVLARWWKLLLTMLAVSVVVGVGVLFCIVPGVVFWTWFLIATPIVALERSWGTEAMSRSYNLVAGHGWRVFLTWFLLQLMVAVVTYAVVLPFNLVLTFTLMEAHPALMQTIMQAASMVVQIVLRPVAMIAIVLIYYDLRIRKEGFDLVMMARELRNQGTSPGTQSGEQPVFPTNEELPPRPIDQADLPPRPSPTEE